MLFISVVLISFAFATAYRDVTHKYSEKYIDEVLSIYLPKAVENLGLDSYKMPNFSVDVRNRLLENEVLSGNINVICTIVLPRVEVRYKGRYEEETGHASTYRDRVHQRDFYGEVLARDIEALIEVTISNDDQKPSLTKLVLLGVGEVKKRFQYDDESRNEHVNLLDVPFEQVGALFYRRCSHEFQKVFNGSYRKAFERAVANHIHENA
ncbi:uncharacterized protein TNIN_385341 [Trichonephila inaurata madagascariensis]|uniref:Secreted protein n=1 Tax=Trichonephila inaurata madagascariensis TaxID=2747483 RepID=A0A8X6YF66_9ARAC|nr:uncharacterized protein TNIN_385341 [Trichonephila inaurata madagascariensis]